MPLVAHNHMVQEFPTDAPDEAFHIRILPWTSWSDSQVFPQV